jgi:hypothetical protein
MATRHATQKPPCERERSSARDDDPVPADIDEFRREIVRRIVTFVQAWRACRRPPCKRGRRCAARMPCAALANRRAVPVHKERAMLANLYRQLQRRVAEDAQRKTDGR